MDEELDIVDVDNKIIGKALRSECHSNPSLRHKTVHILVFNESMDILLQKRAANKNIQPGKWDSSVGGHLALGESFEKAAKRELLEELGLEHTSPLVHLFDMKIENEIESENSRVYAMLSSGPFYIQREEIDKVKFWTKEEIESNINSNIFTPACVEELRKIFKNQNYKVEIGNLLLL